MMSDPVFQGYSTWLTEGETSVSSMEVTMDVASGDLVLALVQRGTQTSCTGVTLGSQSLSLLKSVDSAEVGPSLDVWGGIADSGGTGVSITASYSDSDSSGSMVALHWNNIASSTPSQSSCNTSECSGLASSSTDRTAQEITTSARSLIVGVGSDWNAYHTHTGANGFTKEWDTSVAGGDQIQWAYDKVANAGSFGGASNFGTVDNGADQYIGALLAFDISSNPTLTSNSTGFMTFGQFSIFSNIFCASGAGKSRVNLVSVPRPSASEIIIAPWFKSTYAAVSDVSGGVRISYGGASGLVYYEMTSGFSPGDIHKATLTVKRNAGTTSVFMRAYDKTASSTITQLNYASLLVDGVFTKPSITYTVPAGCSDIYFYIAISYSTDLDIVFNELFIEKL